MSNPDTLPDAAHIRAVVEDSGGTQERIAEHLGLSQTAVSRRMRGLIDWRISELRAVAALLGVTLADLLADSAPADRPEAATA